MESQADLELTTCVYPPRSASRDFGVVFACLLPLTNFVNKFQIYYLFFNFPNAPLFNTNTLVISFQYLMEEGAVSDIRT